MAWRIESEHVDLAEMEHVTVFVEPNVLTRDGKPQRFLLQICLGGGVHPNRNLRANEKGEILTAEGELYDHKARQQEILSKLNAAHSNAKAVATRHGAPIYKGQPK